MNDKKRNTRSTPCESCSGTGEFGTEVGVVDCPDCGGTGVLPSRATLVEWRARDIAKRQSGASGDANDVRFLLAELERARSALTQVVALAMDAAEDDAIAGQIRRTAYDALGLYQEANADEWPGRR